MSALTVFLVTPSTRIERLFSPHTTVTSLRDKVEQLTGLPSASLQLIINGRSLTSQDDEWTLAELRVEEGATVQVSSTDSAAVARLAALDDDAALQGVEKFELTTEEYEKRPDTVRAYKERNRIGRFAEPSTPSSTSSAMETELPATAIGSRCELIGEGRRGTVAFVGETAFASGIWVGVELDEPKEGKGDGSVNGKRYFECQKGHAVFVRSDAVRIGDFPELDLMDEDEEM